LDLLLTNIREALEAKLNSFKKGSCNNAPNVNCPGRMVVVVHYHVLLKGGVSPISNSLGWNIILIFSANGHLADGHSIEKSIASKPTQSFPV
jgi:hypothetical protein